MPRRPHGPDERLQAARRRRAIVEFMKARGLTPTRWCLDAKVGKNVLVNFLNGQSDYLTQRTLERLAAAANATVAEIIGESPIENTSGLARIPILGEAEAGTWRTRLDYLRAATALLTMPKPADVAIDDYAVVARGTGADQLFPDGTTVVCRPTARYGRPLRRGNIVHVARTNGRGLIEQTLREVDQGPRGRLYLYMRTSDPEHREAPVPLPTPDTASLALDNGDRVRIVGVALYAIPVVQHLLERIRE